MSGAFIIMTVAQCHRFSHPDYAYAATKLVEMFSQRQGRRRWNETGVGRIYFERPAPRHLWTGHMAGRHNDSLFRHGFAGRLLLFSPWMLGPVTEARSEGLAVRPIGPRVSVLVG